MGAELLAGLVLGLNLATVHSAPGFETATPGIYARAEMGLSGGLYRNSHGRASAWLGWTWESGSFLGERRFAVTVGAVTGYPAKPVMPLLVPSVRFGLAEGVDLRLALIPKPPQVGSAWGLSLAVEHRF